MTRTARTLSLLIALGAVGCSESRQEAEEAISRERFIEVYVALRIESEQPDGLDPELRDEILSEHGVEADDLLHFVEVHGADVAFMSAVWSEIETRLTEVGESG